MLNQISEARRLVVPFFAAVMTLVAVLNLSLSAVSAQELTEAEQKKRIATVYEQTHTAKTAKDYTRFVDSCQELAKQNYSEKNQAYLKSLIAWGLNRRGEKRLETAELLLTADSIEQGDEALVTAAKDFEDATQFDPKRARAWLCFGIANARMHKLEVAISNFSKAIELSPKNPKAYFNRAEVRYEAGQFDKAIEDYDYVLKSDSGELEALTGRGHCYFALAEYEKAFSDYNSVAGLSPDDPMSLANRAEANQMLGRWQDAYDDYMSSINQKENVVALQKLAWMLATSPEESFLRPQESLQLCKRASDIADSPKLMETQAAAESANGNFAKAEALQLKAQDLAKSHDTRLQARLAFYKNDKSDRQSERQAKRESTQHR